MKASQDIVWDAITNSAKSKFDYSSFENQFKEVGENIADNILFKIIIGYASKKTSEILSEELIGDMMMLGYLWEINELKDFLRNKENLFKTEIFACQMAANLLEDGSDPIVVLNTINQFLN